MEESGSVAVKNKLRIRMRIQEAQKQNESYESGSGIGTDLNCDFYSCVSQLHYWTIWIR
jgi:hypothetical protein